MVLKFLNLLSCLKFGVDLDKLNLNSKSHTYWFIWTKRQDSYFINETYGEYTLFLFHI